MLKKIYWSFQFAVAEIRSEWLFGLGVSLAICSVMTPMALLWGTKTGIIDTMRSRLLRDPVIREIVGQENIALPVTWFDEMRADPRVAFVTPSVRRISLYGNVSVSGGNQKTAEVAYLPTGVGDPVGGGVDWNAEKPGIPVPCMMTSRAAEEIGAALGSEINIEQSRFEGGKPVKAVLKATVQRILEPHESSGMSVFLPLAVIERIEDYKDGQAVPIFNWEKSELDSLRIYDSIRVKIKNIENQELLANAIKSLGEYNNILVTGDPVEGNFGVSGRDDGIDHAQMIKIARIFSSFSPLIRLEAQSKVTNYISAGSLMPSDIVFKENESDWLTLAEIDELEKPAVAQAGSTKYLAACIASEDGGYSYVRLAVADDWTQKKIIQVPSLLVGVIGAAKRRTLEFNQETGEFRPIRKQYPGFRLYAKELEGVKVLRMLCAENGIQVSTNEERIQSVLYLDESLGKFLAFIIVAGGVGGIGALFTSLYLSIERSRRQFSVLQILGIPRIYVFLATVFQVTFMVLVGVIASYIFFQMGALLLSSVLAPGSADSSNVCVLTASNWSALTGAAVISALISALLALRRLRFKDPALVARSE
jgi:putative ABC transport system permease protein